MPTSKAFIHKYGLGAANSVQAALNSLINKELTLRDEKGYLVYDVFFSLWLKLKP